jgi:drug/metabolite transporter (DMT)-like permease
MLFDESFTPTMFAGMLLTVIGVALVVRTAPR